MIDPIDHARQKLTNLAAAATSPAVLCSFGKDSMLVLALAREIWPEIPVVWFRTGTDESFARRMIVEWDLTVLAPSPTDRYLLANAVDTTMVYEYGFGGGFTLPVLQDLGPGTTCALKPIDLAQPFYYPFDLLLVGWKDTDTHWVKGESPLATDGFQMGGAKMAAPIRHMTDEQVMDAIRELNIPYQPVDDALPICTSCMTGEDVVFCPEQDAVIPVHHWDRDESTTAFRTRYHLED